MNHFAFSLAGALTAFASLALVGCASHAPSEDAATASEEVTADGPSALATYFLVTHRDLRRCAWPTCGGVYVQRVNRATTRCTDGSYRDECRVLIEDLSALTLSDPDISKITQTFEDGHALLRGALVSRTQNGVAVPALAATEAWVANAITEPLGRFYLVKDNGVRCATYPCPSLDERKLNYATTATRDGVDFAASGANDKQVQGAQNALYADGVIVAGYHETIRGPAGRGTELVATEFYTRAPASAPTPKACGGIAGFQCPEGQTCDVTVEHACGGADLMGACIVPPEVCSALYVPVCGCDRVTYPNDCHRQRAGVQLDHAGACAQ